MYIKYSNYLEPNPIHHSIGELLTKFSDPNHKLKTKNLNSKLITVGSSLYNLVEFPEFVYASQSQTISYSFLKFSIDEYGKVNIVTKLPFIYINDVLGVEIDEDTKEVDDYIAVNLDGNLINVPEKQFNLTELAEVTNLTLTSEYSNYVLTWNTVFNYKSSKDYFSKYLHGHWTIQPETTRIEKFNDVLANPALIGHVFRTSTSTEQYYNGSKLTATFLSIAWDQDPKLGNNLDVDDRYITNQYYSTKLYELDKSFETITITPEFSNYRVECTSDVITISLDFASLLSIDTIAYIQVCLVNFKGVLNFSSLVIFENGIPPQLSGDENILNIMVQSTANGIRTTILQKNINLSGVTK